MKTITGVIEAEREMEKCSGKIGLIQLEVTKYQMTILDQNITTVSTNGFTLYCFPVKYPYVSHTG